jgi:hypothetical protein
MTEHETSDFNFIDDSVREGWAPEGNGAIVGHGHVPAETWPCF